MSIKELKKEDLELLSNKDITNLLLEEKGCQNTADLFQKIIELLDLPKSTFDEKIGDYFTSLTTDKRFVMLEDGTWDLRSRHTIDKVVKVMDEEDDEDLEDISQENEELEIEEDTFDLDSDDDEDTFDDRDDDLKDLVILDEDELELEQ